MKLIQISFIVSLLFLFVNCLEENPVEHVNEDLGPVSTGTILDSAIINQLIEKIIVGDYGEIHSLLIYKSDTLIVERYFQGYSSQELHVCYSVTKSFTSALIGIALDSRYIKGINSNLLAFFPEYSNVNNPSNWKSSITLEDILSMSAGFQWDEWTYSYNDSRNDVNGLINSSDWMKYMLDLPVIYAPGSIFTYNSGCTMLLSGIIKNSTGLSAKDFAVQKLFTPLGIANYIWPSGPNDITNTGWGLQLKPRDMLKLGRLFLQKGNWNGEQLLSENWINYSTNTKISISNSFEYACQWWRIKNSSSIGNVLLVNDVFFANGWGGQFIQVVPHLDMVVVSTGGNFETGNEALYFFRDYILPAAYCVKSEIAILNSSLTEN